VMRHLGIDRAHFQGLSLGGSIALQYAHDYPDTVQSLAVMEPGILEVFGTYPDVMKIMGNVGELYMSGDRDGALKAFLEELIGPDFDEELSRHLPEGWYARTRSELDVLFQHENPMLENWEFNEEHAKQITCPVLNVTGELSRPYFKDVHELMKEWFPQAENAVVPDTGHFMLETNPRACADILSTFFRKYPLQK
jgi:pimeloyl-ACP methyl ester carboxylesterase